MEDEVEVPWRVTDLKQYAFCPRLLYYSTCLPQLRPTTYKMKAGRQAHETAEDLEQRRSLHTYGLKAGERHFNVSLVSRRLGMRGKVDLVIEAEIAGQREAIPVDYKLSEKVAGHWELQLTAYAVMLEEAWGVPVRRGFFYLIPLRRARQVPITVHLRTRLDETLLAMKAILFQEKMPPPPLQRAKCVPCEFRRFCNDVL